MKPASNLKLRSALLACTFAATAFVSHAFAQGQAMQVNVPFAFHNGSQHLPAGVYRVEVESNHVILLRGQSRSGFAITNPAITNTASSTGKVIFTRYGDQYYLSEVWPGGSETGEQCVKSRQEKEAQLAQNWAGPITRELALNKLPR
jgi:hypothetical protein